MCVCVSERANLDCVSWEIMLCGIGSLKSNKGSHDGGWDGSDFVL